MLLLLEVFMVSFILRSTLCSRSQLQDDLNDLQPKSKSCWFILYKIKVISISSIILNGTNGCILVIKLKKKKKGLSFKPRKVLSLRRQDELCTTVCEGADTKCNSRGCGSGSSRSLRSNIHLCVSRCVKRRQTPPQRCRVPAWLSGDLQRPLGLWKEEKLRRNLR